MDSSFTSRLTDVCRQDLRNLLSSYPLSWIVMPLMAAMPLAATWLPSIAWLFGGAACLLLAGGYLMAYNGSENEDARGILVCLCVAALLVSAGLTLGYHEATATDFLIGFAACVLPAGAMLWVGVRATQLSRMRSA